MYKKADVYAQQRVHVCALVKNFCERTAMIIIGLARGNRPIFIGVLSCTLFYTAALKAVYTHVRMGLAEKNIKQSHPLPEYAILSVAKNKIYYFYN